MAYFLVCNKKKILKEYKYMLYFAGSPCAQLSRVNPRRKGLHGERTSILKKNKSSVYIKNFDTLLDGQLFNH